MEWEIRDLCRMWDKITGFCSLIWISEELKLLTASQRNILKFPFSFSSGYIHP